jgi:pilus assembly protein CpaE
MFEALMSPERIDATFIAATMDHLSDHLSLYSRQIRFGQDIQTYSAGLPQLYPPLRAEFDTIITDLPRTRLLQNPELAAQFEALVLVIPTGFSGVNAARRLIEGIADHAPDTRIIPVLSDLRPDAKLSRKDIATTIGRGIVATLPRCDAPLTRAHRAARPLIEMQPNGAYAKALRTIWSAVQTDAAKPKARSFLKRMLP